MGVASHVTTMCLATFIPVILYVQQSPSVCIMQVYIQKGLEFLGCSENCVISTPSHFPFFFPPAVMASVDKGSFIDMLKGGGVQASAGKAGGRKTKASKVGHGQQVRTYAYGP